MKIGIIGTHTLNLVLPKEPERIDDNPRQSTTEIHDFMHKEGHEAGSQDIVLHVSVPCCPESLEDV